MDNFTALISSGMFQANCRSASVTNLFPGATESPHNWRFPMPKIIRWRARKEILDPMQCLMKLRSDWKVRGLTGSVTRR